MTQTIGKREPRGSSFIIALMLKVCYCSAYLSPFYHIGNIEARLGQNNSLYSRKVINKAKVTHCVALMHFYPILYIRNT